MSNSGAGIWTFDLGEYRFSTQQTVVGEVVYERRIIPKSFNGVTERLDLSGQLVAPNDLTFDVGNADGQFAPGDFEGESCLISIVMGGEVSRSWRFRVTRAVAFYGKVRCWCSDFMQEHMEGSYPNTPAPKEEWPSDDADVDDDYCIPVVLGTAYIPVRSVNTGLERYYVLGEAGSIVPPEPEPEPEPETWDYEGTMTVGNESTSYGWFDGSFGSMDPAVTDTPDIYVFGSSSPYNWSMTPPYSGMWYAEVLVGDTLYISTDSTENNPFADVGVGNTVSVKYRWVEV